MKTKRFGLLFAMVVMILGCTQTAQTVTVQADVLGHWRLDDGTGTVIADSSGNGNTGQATNVHWTQGVRNSGLLFDNKGCIDCGNDASLNPSGGITIEAWMKPWNLPYDTYPTVVHKEGAYALRFAPGGKLSVLIWSNGTQHELTSKNTEWKNSIWCHLAATYDGSKLTLYVNGKKDNETTLAKGSKIDTSGSNCYIGSIDGKSRFRGRMDEIRIVGRGLSPSQVKSSYEKGLFEIERENSRFSAFFSKKDKRIPTEAVKGFIWIDAEDFTDYGGWWMDTQFVPQMGSPYLLAAGIGNPVADASTTLTIAKSGTYKLWVRSKNWLKSHSPGTFKVSVDGKDSSKVFGKADSEKWLWEDGGTFKLKKGDAAIALTDLTGYYGRCDALILTTDLGYVPPNELTAYKNERNRLTGRIVKETTVGDFDVIVVGAGVAGCNAAIASARTGAETALIQDRPMLGGNNSLELGCVVSGPSNSGKPNARESGLNEEIGRLRAFSYHGKWSQGAEIVAAKEPKLTIFLNTHVYDVQKNGDAIKAVKAFDMVTDERTRYTADVFIDCTGDGWLGYYAGAEYMQGRESRDKFGESNGPPKADNITMSGCLMSGHTLSYQSYDTGSPCPFVGPDWLWDLTFNTEHLQSRNGYKDSHISGRWWHENKGDVDDLWDPEAARDGLIRLNLSYWNWIKNHSSYKEEAANRKLRLIPIGNAKRETRRLVGDHILTQDEVLRAEPFPDRVAYAGWGLDIHHPEGLFSKEGPFDYNTRTPLNHIPLRILYSKNVDNLLFAGRNVSVTHVTLGTVRVQGTTGVMGQAVGTAAALCVKHDTTPRGLYKSHVKELQQKLLKDDHYIIGLKNEDPADLALGASVTASSEKSAMFSAWNVINGVSRIVKDRMNMWMSDPAESMPQWIQLDLAGDKTFNTVYLTFDTDLNDARHCTWEHKEEERLVPESVKDYKVQYHNGTEWVTLVEIKNNYQRRRIHRFDAVTGSKLKVVIDKTNGDPSARIFEIRLYNE